MKKERRRNIFKPRYAIFQPLNKFLNKKNKKLGKKKTIETYFFLYLSWLVVAVLLGDEGSDSLLDVVALIDGDRPADVAVAGVAHLLGLVVSVGPRHLLAVLVGNLLAVLLRNLI